MLGPCWHVMLVFLEALRCQVFGLHNSISILSHSRGLHPNLWWFCSLPWGILFNGLHCPYLYILRQSQSHQPPGWRKWGVLCVTRVLVSICICSIHWECDVYARICWLRCLLVEVPIPHVTFWGKCVLVHLCYQLIFFGDPSWRHSDWNSHVFITIKQGGKVKIFRSRQLYFAFYVLVGGKRSF